MADPNVSGQLPEYDALRRRLKNQFTQKNQEQQDVLQRRYASQGMLNSGAYAKEEQMRADQAGRDEADAMGQLDFAQAQEGQRRKEVAEQRAFQTSERLGAQQFSQGMFDRDQAFKEKMFSDESKARWAQIDLANKEFEESKKANELNAVTALGQADMSGEDFNHYMDQYRQIRGSNASGPQPQAGAPVQGAAPQAPQPGKQQYGYYDNATSQMMLQQGYKFVANPGDPRGGMWVRSRQ